MSAHDLTSIQADGAAVLAEAAMRSVEPQPLDPTVSLYAVVTPPDSRLELVDTEKLLAPYHATPARATGTHIVSTVESFIDFTRRHIGMGETTTIWVHPTSGEITAVLNDHGRDAAAQWGDHRIKLALLHTEEWRRWTSVNGQLLDQAKFAEHIQEGIGEIAEPPAADLLEIVQTMQGRTDTTWKAGAKIVDGSVQIQYSEEATATAGQNGQLNIPTTFILVMAPFIGEEKVRIDALLRWRVERGGGTLKIGYKLQNPEIVIRQALEGIADRIRHEFPGIVYIGTPRIGG